MSRKVVAKTVSLATVKEREAPTAASEPTASPSAVVAVEPVCIAVTLRLPSNCSALPVPICAMVSLLATEMATTGVTAVPPAAPPLASVVTVWSPVAESVISSAFARVAPFLISARVSLSAMFRAIDAPTPRLSPVAPSLSGRAVAVLDVIELAVRIMLPPLILTDAPDSISASAFVLTTLIASDPATPTFDAPAPDVACALKVLVAGIND